MTEQQSKTCWYCRGTGVTGATQTPEGVWEIEGACGPCDGTGVSQHLPSTPLHTYLGRDDNGIEWMVDDYGDHLRIARRLPESRVWGPSFTAWPESLESMAGAQ